MLRPKLSARVFHPMDQRKLASRVPPLETREVPEPRREEKEREETTVDPCPAPLMPLLTEVHPPEAWEP